MTARCPKCDADISESYEEDDPSVGIVGGYYCDACDCAYGFDEVGGHGPQDDDVPIFFINKEDRDAVLADPDAVYAEDRPRGTPVSELSTRPGEKGYAEWVRISKSWGYD